MPRTVKPICLQCYVITLTQYQIRHVEFGLQHVHSSYFFFFFFPSVEILFEQPKETWFSVKVSLLTLLLTVTQL